MLDVCNMNKIHSNEKNKCCNVDYVIHILEMNVNTAMLSQKHSNVVNEVKKERKEREEKSHYSSGSTSCAERGRLELFSGEDGNDKILYCEKEKQEKNLN